MTPTQRAALELALEALETDDRQKKLQAAINIRVALAEQTDSYVQQVPDKCDRIMWRNSYYHLPLQQPVIPPGYKLVSAGALQMVVNALRRDASEGKVVRGEMVDELLAAAPEAPPARRERAAGGQTA